MSDCGEHVCHDVAAAYGRPWSALLALLASLGVARGEVCCCDARDAINRAVGLPYVEHDELAGTRARALVNVRAGVRLRIGRELPAPTGPPTGARSPYWTRATAGHALYGDT